MRSKKVKTSISLPITPQGLNALILPRLQNPKESTIAKIALVLDECYRLSINPKHSTPRQFQVGASWADRRLSRIQLKSGGSIRLMKFLVELGLIKVVAPHRSTIAPKAISYQFCETKFRRYEIEVPIPVLEKRQATKSKPPPRRNKALEWVSQSLRRASLPQTEIEKLKSDESLKPFIDRFLSSNDRASLTRGIYINHAAKSFPKKSRSLLRFDGTRKVKLLDISSAHPVVLPWLIDDITAYYKRKDIKYDTPVDLLEAEVSELREALSSGNFYESFRHSGKSRKRIKKAFLRSLNGSCDPEAIETEKAFRARFPISSKILKTRRGNSQRINQPSAFSDELQGRVTNILQEVIKKCRLAKIPCLPVTDELIVPFSDRAQVKEWLIEEIHSKTGVNAKVS